MSTTPATLPGVSSPRKPRAAARPLRLGLWLVLAVGVIGLNFVEDVDLGGAIIFFPFAIAALGLVLRLPRQPIGWILILVALSFAVVGGRPPGTAAEVLRAGPSAWLAVRAWMSGFASTVFFGALTALAVLFPGGRFGRGRVAQVGRIAVAAPALLVGVLAFIPSNPVNFPDGTVQIANPIGLARGWPGWDAMRIGAYTAIVVCLALGVVSLVVRFRAARGIERAQYKWLLAALSLTLVAVVFAFFMIVFVDSVGTWMWWPAVLGYPAIPLAIWIAVLRYRLYEIDRLVSRTVGWALLTAILAGIFVAVVLGLQAIISPIAGSNGLAVAVSTLIVVALFQPLHRRVQAAVDRRFNRSRYDAAQMLAEFAPRLRGGVDPELLRYEIASTVGRALEPASVSVWLRR